METSAKPSTWLRIASLIVACFVMFFTIILFSMPALHRDSFGLFRITHEPYKLPLLSDPAVYLSMLGFSLLLLKDCINGRSITKRLLKIQVVDQVTGEAASPLQCLIRNSCLLLLPIEVLAVLAQPDRRIGDKLAGTRVVLYKATASNTASQPLKKFILPFVLGYTIPVVLAFAAGTVSFNKSAAAFVPASYNAVKSQELQKLLDDHLSNYYSYSVRYYDSIEHKNYDYVSIICTAKDTLLQTPGISYAELEKQTVSLLYSVMPQDQFHGKIRYVFRSENSLTTWNQIAGVRFTGDEE